MKTRALIVVALASTCACAFASSAHASVQLEACDLETPELPRVHAECGSIVVDDGATIGFAVLHATDTKKKQSDPLVLLPGGPGQSSTELAGLATLMFAPFRKHRDVILFDPRGTGRSHKLACPKRTIEQKLQNNDDADAKYLAECASKLDLDPRSITTPRIAKDLEAVREALDVTTWNVAGISYGTRLALEYNRLYPGKARTLILDGPVPFSMIIGEHAARDAEAALDDVAARAHEPDLRERATALKKKLDEKPVDVVLPDPKSGQKRAIHVDGRAFGAALHGMLYAEETAALLPQVVREAERDNFVPLAAQIVLANTLEESVALPMQLSVLCSEDVALYPRENEPQDRPDLDAEARRLFSGMLGEMRRACAVWPHADVDTRFHDDGPTSQALALVLAGTADPVTPVYAGHDVQKTLPGAVVVEAKGFGHNIVFRECIPKLVGEFLDAPSTFASKKTDIDACVSKLNPFPIFIDASGPSP